MAKSLRTFLREALERDPDAVQQIDAPVDRKFAMAAHAARLAKRGEHRGLLFTNVEGSDFPCLTNLMTSYDRYGLAIGCAADEVPRAYGERLAHPIEPVEVAREGAPVKDVVLHGEQCDLAKLPIPWHNERDAGAYIDSGMTVIRHPDTGIMNIGIYRQMVLGAREVTNLMLGTHHGALILEANEARDRRTPVAIVIGHHPAFMMGAVAMLARNGGEYEAAGALMGEPVEVVRAETSDLLVPAHAEFVIEGYMEPHVRRREGPFGEWAQHYLGGQDCPVITITAITHRRDAIYQDVISAAREHQLMGGIPRAGSIYHAVKQAVPGVKAVNVPAHSRMHCYISLKRFKNLDAKRAALAALVTEPQNLRMVVVVDDDIDVFNDGDVLWAIGTRFDAARDLTILKDWSGPGGPLPTNFVFAPDGSSTETTSSAVIIDATKPAPPAYWPERTKVPDADVARVDLDAIRPMPPSSAWLGTVVR